MTLKDTTKQFKPDSEEEVRAFLAGYFQDLGFGFEEMSFEDSFKVYLGHTEIEIKKRGKGIDKSQTKSVEGRSDMLLKAQGKPFAIVETKDPDVKLTDQDAKQGISYARLLLDMPPFTILTNGRELKIYDTLTAKLLETGSPIFTERWFDPPIGVSNEDKKQAAKTLISLNYEILKNYCTLHVENNMVDLKGTPDQLGRYSSLLHTSRTTINESFDNFLLSNFLCFALIGDSGIGKSNEMCAIVENIKATDHLVLFYRGGQLLNSLQNSLANDFEWEFERTDPPARIINRFADLARKHNTKLVIFIDGLDEYTGNIEILKEELVFLSSKLDPKFTRLCVSCKVHDWKRFIYDRNQILNIYGKTIFPQNKEEFPGFWLHNFDQTELTNAWDKYKAIFNISSDLRGETRKACEFPLMLRLVCETYKNSTKQIPSNLTNIEIFHKYWDHKISGFPEEQQLLIERIVCEAAECFIKNDSLELDETDFMKSLDTTLSASLAYKDTVRYSFLTRQKREHNTFILTFPFEKLLSYAYTLKTRKWHRINNGESISNEINRIIFSRLGRSVLYFYLEVYEGGVSGWLIPLIESNCPLFIEIMGYLPEWTYQTISSMFTLTLTGAIITTSSPSNEQITISQPQTTFPFIDEIWVNKYHLAYAALRKWFPVLNTRLDPFLIGQTGLWLHKDDKDQLWHGFRTLSQSFPNFSTELNEYGWIMMQSRPFPPEPLEEILPDGGGTTVSWDRPSRKLPESAAWAGINSKIASLVHYRCLDESKSPGILLERINDTLRYQPSSGVGNSPSGKYWELLGFTTFQEARGASCVDLIEKARALVLRWKPQKQNAKPNDMLARWYHLETEELLRFIWYLKQYQSFAHSLSSETTKENFFEGLEYASKEYFKKLPEAIKECSIIVLENLYSIIKNNLPEFLETVAKIHSEDRVLIEISCPPFSEFQCSNGELEVNLQNPHGGHYIYLSYIWLPSAPKGSPVIKVVSWQHSIAEKYVEGK